MSTCDELLAQIFEQHEQLLSLAATNLVVSALLGFGAAAIFLGVSTKM